MSCSVRSMTCYSGTRRMNLPIGKKPLCAVVDRRGSHTNWCAFIGGQSRARASASSGSNTCARKSGAKQKSRLSEPQVRARPHTRTDKVQYKKECTRANASKTFTAASRGARVAYSACCRHGSAVFVHAPALVQVTRKGWLPPRTRVQQRTHQQMVHRPRQKTTKTNGRDAGGTRARGSAVQWRQLTHVKSKKDLRQQSSKAAWRARDTRMSMGVGNT